MSLSSILIQLKVQEPTYWEKLLSCWFINVLVLCVSTHYITSRHSMPVENLIGVIGWLSPDKCNNTYDANHDTHWMVTFLIASTVGLWHYVIAALLSNKFESGLGYFFLVLFILDPLLLLVGLLSQNCLGQMVLMRGGIGITFTFLMT